MSDDDNDICPICCEELDLSDKQFYPCKCGYQVCMWCWHRIRESESGLCPACRTPYGNDPHEFSAVDMQEVVKANKEKAKAEKKERELLRAQREQEVREGIIPAGPAPNSGNFATVLGSAGWSGELLLNPRVSDAVDLASVIGERGLPMSKGPPEPPKDRSVLATMRVIRRNLVYAVGMPPNIATEDLLKKAEYFGQYGRIAKIVINRNHNPCDPRRASASAYVTFVHKEDTLACILALDGFYYDGRNIRASYGTSKYCSAFIKSVKCSNPDCTYLHHMGDAEDTFTKQEIQAGYVTSGRDVLARQQQIMAQLQTAALGNSAGHKKIGGGGPSGSGKASSNPIFPPPTYDESLSKPVVSNRSQSTVTQRIRHTISGVGTSSAATGIMTGAPSVASIVAGNSNSIAIASPAPHTTLTPLIPIKRSVSGQYGSVNAKTVTSISKPVRIAGLSSNFTPVESLTLQDQIKEPFNLYQREMTTKNIHQNEIGSIHDKFAICPSSSAETSVSNGDREYDSVKNSTRMIGVSRNGSDVSGSNLNMGAPLLGGNFSGNLETMYNFAPTTRPHDFGSIDHSTGSGIIGGQPIGRIPIDDPKSDLINGITLSPQGNIIGLDPLLPGNISHAGRFDRWGAAAAGTSYPYDANGSLNIQSEGMWGIKTSASQQPSKRKNPAPIGPTNRNGTINIGSDISGASLFGTNQYLFPNAANGSSALASMLKIELPTGSGSLRESSTVFTGGYTSQTPIGGSVNNIECALATKAVNMTPIGTPTISQGATIGENGCGGGNSSDMALLQSLLPGVNITSGNAFHPAAPQQVGVGSLNLGNHSGSTDKWNHSGIQHQYTDQDQQHTNIW